MSNKRLYESIMKNVKKSINEAYWFDNPDDLRLSNYDIEKLAKLIYDETSNGYEASSIEFESENEEYLPVTFEWHLENGKIICDYVSAGWCDRDGDEDECNVLFNMKQLQTAYDLICNEI